MALLVFLKRSPRGLGIDYPDRGDVIAVLADGRSPGTKVTALAGFYQIQVPGDVAQWQHLLESDVELFDRGDGERIAEVTRLRKNRLDASRLSLDNRNELEQGVLNLESMDVEGLAEIKRRLPQKARVNFKATIRATDSPRSKGE